MKQFDHHSPTFAREWRDQYRELQQSCPVARTDAHGGYVLVTRHDDVRKVLLDPKTFACGRDLTVEEATATGRRIVPGGVTIPTNPFRMGMMEMDPPESIKLRRLLVPWFSTNAVEVNAPHILDLVTWCIDCVIESGSLDVVEDLANPLPALVTMDLLGLPLTDWKAYAAVLHGAVFREAGSAKGVAWLLADLRSFVARRRADPAAVLTPVDALLTAEIDGSPLEPDLVVELIYMLLSGGVDTSTALISHAVRYVSAHPELADELRSTPDSMPGAVQEMVRYFSPATGVARTVLAPAVLGDVELAAGERILLALGAANNDPARFPAPDVLDLGRDADRNLAFGAGVHRCLGSVLAAREVGIALGEVLRRMPDLVIDESRVVPYPSSPLVSGFTTMPGSFTPAARAGVIATDGPPPARDLRQRARTADVVGAQPDGE